jgi:hypothetical protein
MTMTVLVGSRLQGKVAAARQQDTNAAAWLFQFTLETENAFRDEALKPMVVRACGKKSSL